MALFTDYLRQKYGLYGLLKSLNYPLSFGVRFAKVYQPIHIFRKISWSSFEPVKFNWPITLRNPKILSKSSFSVPLHEFSHSYYSNTAVKMCCCDGRNSIPGCDRFGWFHFQLLSKKLLENSFKECKKRKNSKIIQIEKLKNWLRPEVSIPELYRNLINRDSHWLLAPRI